MRRITVLLTLCVAGPVAAVNAQATTLGIDGSRFTLNGKPTFLLGFSYYGALGASEDFIRQDLDDAQRHRFNWLRVWVTWEGFGHDVSAVDPTGKPRQPYMDRLKWLVAECDRRGLIVDLTLTRGNSPADAPIAGRLANYESHKRAVEALVNTLKPHRNWFLDLANERDVRDARYVPVDELKTMRALVRRLSPTRVVTASFGGGDRTEKDLRDALLTAKLDFICPHRPRDAKSPGQTEAWTRRSLELMKKVDRVAPVLYQEPFRRGYTAWEPSATDFLADLRGAVAGGAAGWCFHNGSQAGTPDKEPRRSFDLHNRRLFDQLDAEEQKVVREVDATVHPTPAP